ncbi:hypothetical protein SAMN05661096_02776 [Marivirga sericea]|uniref:Uncharacterized protein n=1 Tax=Marivirga sericea TaxID=1028 RepID=A0A1X7KIW1_9BACT|nr:hypothetical protein SAMN05661096_02776 [Marivirga sericea]
MKPFWKRFFLLCLLISWSTKLLVPQSLNDKNVDTSSSLIEKKVGFIKQIENSSNEVSDSSRKSLVIVKSSKQNSGKENFRLKSRTGVYSVFNEIIYYWFHQL